MKGLQETFFKVVNSLGLLGDRTLADYLEGDPAQSVKLAETVARFLPAGQICAPYDLKQEKKRGGGGEGVYLFLFPDVVCRLVSQYNTLMERQPKLAELVEGVKQSDSIHAIAPLSSPEQA